MNFRAEKQPVTDQIYQIFYAFAQNGLDNFRLAIKYFLRSVDATELPERQSERTILRAGCVEHITASQRMWRWRRSSYRVPGWCSRTRAYLDAYARA